MKKQFFLLSLALLSLSSTTKLFGQLEYIGRYEYEGKSEPKDFVIHENVGYLAAGEEGLFILDLSNPAKISKLSDYTEYKIESRRKKWGIAETVNVLDDKLFLAFGDLGFKLFSIENAKEPKLLGSYLKFKYVHSVEPTKDYAILGLPNGIKLVDYKDPEKMEMLSLINYEEYPVKSIQNLSNFIFCSRGEHGIKISTFDVQSYKFVGYPNKFDTHGVTNKIILDKFLIYNANGPEGLQILNINLPTYPAVEGELKTKKKITDIFLKDKLIIAAAESFIYLIDVTDPKNPTLLNEFENKALEYIKVYYHNNYLYSLFKTKKKTHGIEVYKLN